MSGYIMNPAHFHAIASFAACRNRNAWRLPEHKIIWILNDSGFPRDIFPPSVKISEQMSDIDLATVICTVLHSANVASVRYSNPNLDDDQLPGPVPHPTKMRPVQIADLVRRKEKPMDILAALDGLESQCNLHPGWRTSAAKMIVDAIRSLAIKQLDGYFDSNCRSISE